MKESCKMKGNKWNLITAFLDLAAGICFACTATLQAEMFPKVLYGIAAVCFLIGSAGFFCVYYKREKRR